MKGFDLELVKHIVLKEPPKEEEIEQNEKGNEGEKTKEVEKTNENESKDSKNHVKLQNSQNTKIEL